MNPEAVESLFGKRPVGPVSPRDRTSKCLMHVCQRLYDSDGIFSSYRRYIV